MERPRALSVLLALILLGGAAGGAAALPSSQPEAPPTELQHPQQETPTTNETQHEDPDDTDGEGNLSDLSGWLANWLGQRLANSTVQLSDAQYNRARSLLGDSFDERLEQYVDVAGETEGSSDDEAANTLNRTRQLQAQYIERYSEYRETLTAYREARRAGNITRARRLARELQRLVRRLNDLAAQLERSYIELGNLTGIETDDSVDRIDEIQQNATETVEGIEEASFISTTLEVSATDRQISFLEPLKLTGRLTTENGSAVANRAITLAVGGQILNVTTDESGAFSATYRPTVLPLDTASLTVRYLPRNLSTYLGAAATLDVSVSQVEPSVRLERVSSAVAYNETLTVSGRVAAAGHGAAQVPLVVTLDGMVIARTATTADGTFTVQARVPAGVPTGDAQLRVRVATSDLALGPAETTTTVQIRETDTTLSVQARQVEDLIRVSGELRTVDGDALPGRQLRLEIGDESTLVQTGPDGTFTATVPARAVLNATDGSVRVRVSFSGAGTNLGPSEYTSRLTVSGLGDGTSGWEWRSQEAVLLLGGLGLLVVIGALTFRRWPGGSGPPESGGASASPRPPSGPAVDPEAILDRARADLEAGNTDRAVERVYASIRAAVDREGSQPAGLTHWEFLRETRKEVAEVDGATLASLVQRYEQAAYGPDTTSESEASEAIEIGQDLLASLRDTDAELGGPELTPDGGTVPF